MRRSSAISLLTAVCCGAAAPALAETFGNSRITASLTVEDHHLRITAIEDRATHATLKPEEPFVLVMQDGHELRASNMTLTGALTSTVLPPQNDASRAAAHVAGREICGDLADPATQVKAHWCLVERSDSPYLRQEITLQSRAELPLADVQLFRFHNADAHTVGLVAGSPVVSGNFYLGFEHPLSYSTVADGTVTTGLKRTLPLAAGQSITYSSVVGIAHAGQMRRDFLAYVEQERAHPYRTFLHYNTWYDLGFGERFDAAGVLDRMNAFGQELVQRRGVHMDSFLMDDGWDDTRSLWGFDNGFPDGFAPLRATAAKYGFGIGVWLSPWGGYSTEKKERIAYGQSQGYETVKNGYALSGPRYYQRFEEACLNFVQRYGVNQFKFDGTGNADQVFPGSLFDSDFSAAIHLIERLRQQDSQVFINLTTGTKPSPFWLRYADSIWRSGEDHGFAGEGTWRQRWITYRDTQTYRNIVQGGPLFPLNSLMLHGLIYAQKAEHLADDPGHDFTSEVHSYFGSGTQLQEMYLTPSLLSSADWDVLAESAKWARKNASTLRDTHWIGGDPGHGEPYGWASWSTGNAILVLRNPSAQMQPITLDAQAIFELPIGAAQRFAMHSPWAADALQHEVTLDAHHPHTFTLQPFEVLTLQTKASK